MNQLDWKIFFDFCLFIRVIEIMPLKKLFIIESPFQLLQALELVLKNSEQSNIIIRLNGVVANENQMLRICKYFDLKNVKFVNSGGYFGRIKYFVIAWWEVFKNQCIYIGDIDSFVFKKFYFFLKKDKVTLLDDGVATINQTHSELGFARFTIFDNVSGVKTNNFHSICELLYKYPIKSDLCMIIGGKIVEEGIVSKESYYTFLENCSAYGSDLIYVPHRGELDHNVEEIEAKFGFRIVRSDFPVELLALQLEVVPGIILSCLSTALISMSILYRHSDILYFKFREDELLARKESAINVYKYLENMKYLSRMV